MNEFIINGDNIVLNTVMAKAFIPAEYFSTDDTKNSIAKFYDTGIQTIGLFNIIFFNSDDEKIDLTKMRTFSYPSVIYTYPTEYASTKIKLSPADTDDSKYIVLTYYKGDIIMDRRSHMDVGNCELFINLITRGKFANGIGYEDGLKAWMENFKINGMSSGVPNVVLQVIIAAMSRDPSNPSIPFRKIAGTNKDIKNKVVPMRTNMRQNTGYNSVYTSLTFEDMGSMLTSALNMSRDNKPQNRSPMEEILSM